MEMMHFFILYIQMCWVALTQRKLELLEFLAKKSHKYKDDEKAWYFAQFEVGENWEIKQQEGWILEFWQMLVWLSS